MSIYVGNLPFEVEEKHINEIFADYGQVKRVYMPVDRETGRRRGFAFVEMANQSQEASAIAELDQAEWMGRQLKVNKARERETTGREGNYRSEGGYRNKSRF